MKKNGEYNVISFYLQQFFVTSKTPIKVHVNSYEDVYLFMLIFPVSKKVVCGTYKQSRSNMSLCSYSGGWKLIYSNQEVETYGEQVVLSRRRLSALASHSTVLATLQYLSIILSPDIVLVYQNIIPPGRCYSRLASLAIQYNLLSIYNTP